MLVAFFSFLIFYTMVSMFALFLNFVDNQLFRPMP